MSSPVDEQIPFLPEPFTDYIYRFDRAQEQLTYPNERNDPARTQLARAFPKVAALIVGGTHEISAVNLTTGIGEAVSMDHLEDILKLNGLNALLIDSNHAALDSVAALATGVALSTANNDTARHGFELGTRIIGQRARLNAQSLIGALLNSRADLEFDVGGSLLKRASKFYSSGRRSMSPLTKVPKSVGAHVDEISERVYSDEFFDNSHVSGIDIGSRGKGFSSRMRRHFGTAKAVGSLGLRASNPDTATEVVEEIFDTYLGFPVLQMEDLETFMVARFALKTYQYFEIAGRSTPAIRQDPRTKYMGLLVGRLDGMNISKAEVDYKKTAHNVSNEASRT